MPDCSHCLAPLSRREQLFGSLLCSDCERKLTAYEGPLPDPNLSFPVRRPEPGRPGETKLSSSSGKI